MRIEDVLIAFAVSLLLGAVGLVPLMLREFAHRTPRGRSKNEPRQAHSPEARRPA